MTTLLPIIMPTVDPGGLNPKAIYRLLALVGNFPSNIRSISVPSFPRFQYKLSVPGMRVLQFSSPVPVVASAPIVAQIKI